MHQLALSLAISLLSASFAFAQTPAAADKKAAPAAPVATPAAAPAAAPTGKKAAPAESKAAPAEAKAEPAAKKPATAQQNKMKACNATAKEKSLKGDERKKFMKECLSAKK